VVGDPLFTFRFAPLVLAELGLAGETARSLIAETGLPPEAETGPISAPISAIHAFLDRAVQIAGDPGLGLRVGSAAPAGMFGLPEMVVRTAATVDAALTVASRYHHLVNPVGHLVYRSEPRHELEYWVVGGEHGHVLNELSFAYLLRALNLELDAPLRILEAWFSHDRPAGPLEEHFGCPVRMGLPTTGIVLAPESAAAPLRSADPVVHEFLAKQAGEAERMEPVTAMIVRVVEEQVGLPMASLDSVADAIGWSPRSLQRRLKAEGTTFAELLDDLRRRVALAMIARGAGRAETARAVGLSGAASLRRALARWQDLTP